MEYWLVLLAALLSAVWFLVHVFIGGPEIADPLRVGSSDLLFAGTLLASLFTMIGLFVPPMLRQSYRIIPQGWMFLPVAILGALALLIGAL